MFLNPSARQKPFQMGVWSTAAIAQANAANAAEGFSMDYTQVKSRIWDNHLIGSKISACLLDHQP